MLAIRIIIIIAAADHNYHNPMRRSKKMNCEYILDKSKFNDLLIPLLSVALKGSYSILEAALRRSPRLVPPAGSPLGPPSKYPKLKVPPKGSSYEPETKFIWVSLLDICILMPAVSKDN